MLEFSNEPQTSHTPHIEHLFAGAGDDNNEGSVSFTCRLFVAEWFAGPNSPHLFNMQEKMWLGAIRHSCRVVHIILDVIAQRS